MVPLALRVKDKGRADMGFAFLKLVRSNFNVHDEIIHQRFGNVPYLTGSSKEQYISSISRQEDENILAGKIESVAEIKKSFDGLFDKFNGKTVELDVE